MGESKIVNFNKYILVRGNNKMCMEIVEEIQKNRKEGKEYEKEDMNELALKFLNSINYDGIGSVPIIKIAKKCGFKIICGPMIDNKKSGFVSVNKNNEKEYECDKIIGINSNDELGHQRFVIAHELAHFLFDYDMSDKPYFDTYIKNSHKSKKEQVTNAFAANILLPAKYFVLKFNERKSMDSNIKYWVKYFEVQEKSVKKRIFEVINNGI